MTLTGRAARELDQRKPGWEDLINIRTLDMVSTSQCVLGQVFGGYNQGLGRVSFRTRRAYSGSSFGILWRWEIWKRRGCLFTAKWWNRLWTAQQIALDTPYPVIDLPSIVALQDEQPKIPSQV